ncbi:MAG: 5-deoxy-glucuronate isomerase [Oscillospiraceae bacterium]|nr:5-deoxy-glucuronate isomerase [Oscillospiraceae bacterium]MBR0390774.1 5-deoxy-glucuronate isomerase [Oscillospiraceae bacterium]
MKQFFHKDELLSKHSPEEMGLRYGSVQRIEVQEPVCLESGEEELCILVIDGEIEYETDGFSGTAVMPDMLYLPTHSRIRFSAKHGGTLMRYGAPCSRETKFGHIRFAEADQDDRHKVYGKTEDGTRRDVWNMIDENFDSSRFLTGVCKGSNGGWTAWPPHEHGREREEIYVYFNMGDSFGAQFVYDEMDKPIVAEIVRDGDVVTIPHGYHPNVGCPCGGIFYAYVMVSTTAEDRNFMALRTQKIYGDRLE